ncbi:MAG: flavin reductase family protein [Ruminococcaceae bacterium]|nr:flavin reductase family protein [Oscillospiraceae bacterium]
MSKVTWKGGTLLGPIPPVMVTVGTFEEANIITIGWTGIVNTIPPKTYISVRPERYSYEILKEKREFAINLTTVDMVRNADYLGIHTGRKIDKFAKSGLTKEKASQIECPIIGESPLSLECRVTDMIPMGSHDMFLADILCMDVDEALIDKSGKLHLERAHLAAFAHGAYYELGRKIGSFGFSVAKKKKHKAPEKRKAPSKGKSTKKKK